MPTLAPICLSLWGTAGVLREGRMRDYVHRRARARAGRATKYTGGIVLLPLLAATAAQFMAPGGRGPATRGHRHRRRRSRWSAFVGANPYALLDFDEFRDGLDHQSTAADDALGKLGPDPGQRRRLLPVDVHLGAGLGAR